MRAAHRLAAGVDGLLTRERVRNYSWICLVLGLAAQVANAALGHFPLTGAHDVLLPDYLARWTAGRLVLEGHAGVLYDPAAQEQLQHALVPGSRGLSWFVSPPFAVLGYLPLALLPYGVSALGWAVVSVTLLVVAARAVRPLADGAGSPGAGDLRLLLLVFAASPAVLELVAAGQDTAVVLVLVVVALRLLLDGREIAAGTLLALATVKPQLLVLVPVALLAQRRHRAVAAFATGTAALVLLSLPLVGTSGWRSWLAALHSPLYRTGVQQGQTWKMQSVSALATALGAPTVTGWLVLAVGAGVLVVRARRVRSDTRHVWALTLLTTVVCSPHVLQYDLVLLLPVMVFLHDRVDTRAVRLLGFGTVLLLATVAVRHVLAGPLGGTGQLLEAPWSALTLLGVWFALLRVPAGAGSVLPEPATAERR